MYFPTTTILWLNVYFPTDTGGELFDEQEFLEILQAIENIIYNTNFDDVMLNGDLNYDKSRTSEFARTIRRFL